jgi:hypothetical protein
MGPRKKDNSVVGLGKKGKSDVRVWGRQGKLM